MKLVFLLIAQSYAALKDKLMGGIKRKDAEEIEDALDDIAQVPEREVPKDDKLSLEKARALVQKLRTPNCKNIKICSYCSKNQTVKIILYTISELRKIF